MTGLVAAALRASPGKIGLMGHVIANYPSPSVARQLVDIIASNGAKVIEIQIPFSEPMADGPLFLAANQQALERGVTYGQSLEFMHAMTSRYGQEVQFVFMSYLNIVYQRGYGQFVSDAVGVGARGVIIPDLPYGAGNVDQPASAAAFLQECQRFDFNQVQIVPPNCLPERLAALCRVAQGFIYAVARTGVTGAATDFKAAAKSIEEIIARVRALSQLPVAIGFGIKSGADIQFLKGQADLAIVGTHTLQTYQEGGLDGVKNLWKDLKLSSE